MLLNTISRQLDTRYKPQVFCPPLLLGYVYTAAVMYRLQGVLPDPEGLG
jgi:hypothetical protein